MFFPSPDGVDTGYLVSSDRVDERSCADAANIAAVIDKTAGGFDGLLGAWMPHDVVRRVFPILNVPRHSMIRIGPALASGKLVLLLSGMGVACPVASAI